MALGSISRVLTAVVFISILAPAALHADEPVEKPVEPVSPPASPQAADAETPAEPTVVAPITAPPAVPLLPTPAKVGRFMFNFKIGPAVLGYPSLNGSTLVQAALVTEIGIAVTANRNGYLFLPLSFQLSPGAYLITIPIGFQYDIALPVRGLYLTPRGSVGYTAAIAPNTSCSGIGCSSETVVSHLGTITPEIGIKYIFKGRYNLGFDPFSLPISIGNDGDCSVNGTRSVCTNNVHAVLFYRLLFYGGINF